MDWSAFSSMLPANAVTAMPCLQGLNFLGTLWLRFLPTVTPRNSGKALRVQMSKDTSLSFSSAWPLSGGAAGVAEGSLAQGARGAWCSPVAR